MKRGLFISSKNLFICFCKITSCLHFWNKPCATFVGNKHFRNSNLIDHEQLSQWAKGNIYGFPCQLPSKESAKSQFNCICTSLSVFTSYSAKHKFRFHILLWHVDRTRHDGWRASHSVKNFPHQSWLILELWCLPIFLLLTARVKRKLPSVICCRYVYQSIY